jgi:hypothetical protein
MRAGVDGCSGTNAAHPESRCDRSRDHADRPTPSRRGYPLDGWRHGQGGRDHPQFGAAHVQGAPLKPHQVRIFKLCKNRNWRVSCAIASGFTLIRPSMP